MFGEYNGIVQKQVMYGQEVNTIGYYRKNIDYIGTSPIMWTQKDVPHVLRELELNQMSRVTAAKGVWSTDWQYLIKGTQQRCARTGDTQLRFITGVGEYRAGTGKEGVYYYNGSYGEGAQDATYNLKQIIYSGEHDGWAYPNYVSFHSENEGLFCTKDYPAILTVDVIIFVRVIFSCNSYNLKTPTCTQICLPAGGAPNPSCFENTINYCFDPAFANSTTDGISGSKYCQAYIPQYIQSLAANYGPNPLLDNKLSEYCMKYKTFNDLLAATNTNDINVCACFLPQQQYDNLYNSLTASFPEFGAISGIRPQCLFPKCSSTPYKSLLTSQKCPFPNCINIVNFSNGGSIGGDVIFDQNPDCVNLTNTSIGTRIWLFFRNYWPILLIGIIILIFSLVIYFWAEIKASDFFK